MKSRSAFPVGVVGGAAMSAVMFLARLLGLQANLEMMLGTLFLPPGAVAWGVGFVVHLVVSGLIGLLYGRGFERVTHRASAGAGMLLSVVHIIAGGLLLGSVLPALHPLVPEAMPMPEHAMATPGYFMLGLGHALIGLFAFVFVHMVYAAVVGMLYGPVLDPLEPPAPASEA